jgi:hypothetical protein
MNFCDFKFFNHSGGVSDGVFKSLNCDLNSGDDLNNILLNRKIVCNSFDGENKLFMMNQTHSDKVFILNHYDELDKSDIVECDAVITKLPDVLLGISTADCAPIIFFDEKAGVVCACHAGWKGAFSELFQNILFILKNKFNSDFKNINVLIGPMIQQKSYQVQQDFYDQWVKQNVKFNDCFQKQEGKYYFNLRNAIIYKLMMLGIKKINIQNTEIDTYSNSNYSSYRRFVLAGEIPCGSRCFGRNISVVKINQRISSS